MTAETEAQQGQRVLLAEDEALIRLDLAEMLTEAGYEVVGQASNGEEAVSLAESLQPDLIIIGGGVSRKAEKFFPYLNTRAELVPAGLQNEAGIVGAALAVA